MRCMQRYRIREIPFDIKWRKANDEENFYDEL